MQLPQSEKLNISSLSRLFDNKAECYKLFWFQAILTHVCKGKNEIGFEELIDEMIADAWYMVTEYHLNLGPRDTLEKAVNYIASITNMIPSVKKQTILEWLENCKDLEVIRFKEQLTNEVPFRLQSPFFEDFPKSVWSCNQKEKAMCINQQKRLIYYFLNVAKLDTRIQITPEWMDYLLENQEILRGWIQYNMILYLQRRNPSVPGISDKLYPPQERKLDKIKKYWKLLAELAPIHEIYGDTLMTPGSVSIDHFVPWSYVAHDELWNLHPTTRSINSQKGNQLPDWEIYFPRLAALEHQAYQMRWNNDQVKKEFDKCAREHLNNAEIRHRLYREGLSEEVFKGQLREVIYPVYLSAKTCGFKDWKYQL